VETFLPEIIMVVVCMLRENRIVLWQFYVKFFLCNGRG
jgi:hypothetical protein